MHRREQLFGRSRRLYIGFVASIVLRPGRQRSSATPIIAKGLVDPLQNYRASKIIHTRFCIFFVHPSQGSPDFIRGILFVSFASITYCFFRSFAKKPRAFIKILFAAHNSAFSCSGSRFRARSSSSLGITVFFGLCCCGFDSPSTCSTRSRAVPLLSCSRSRPIVRSLLL